METVYELRLTGFLNLEHAQIVKDKLQSGGLPQSMSLSILEIERSEDGRVRNEKVVEHDGDSK